jgi:hypothetical protein
MSLKVISTARRNCAELSVEATNVSAGNFGRVEVDDGFTKQRTVDGPSREARRMSLSVGDVRGTSC